jgi:hypothetical protein
MKVTFDRHAAPGTFDVHWEMNPGPDQGNKKSIILRTGSWHVRGIWADPADPLRVNGEIDAVMEKAGIGNYINSIYFYRGQDGKWHLTDKSDEVDLNIDAGDYLDNPPAGGGGRAPAGGEGDWTNENVDIDIGNSWWNNGNPACRSQYGVVVVKNLSSKVRIGKVSFASAINSSRAYDMPAIGPRNFRSIILGKGEWDAVVYYKDGTDKTLSMRATVKPLGYSNYVNYLYFYYKTGSYHLANNDYPDDAEDDGNSSYIPGGPAAEEEGVSPGGLTDNNRNRYGLLILKNLTKDVDIDSAEFAINRTPIIGSDGNPLPNAYAMIPGPAR